MAIKRNDNNSFAPYKHNEEVEGIVEQAQLRFLESRVDKALEEKLWIENPTEFEKIVKEYSDYSESLKTVDKRLD